MKLKESTQGFFAIPLQRIIIPELNIVIPEQYSYCSIYNPEYQNQDDPIYFIKVYDHFTNDINMPIDIENYDLIFGESRFFAFIPNRGRMKWTTIKKSIVKRPKSSLPDLKDGFNSDELPETRSWYIFKNGGLENGDIIKSTYNTIQNLEFALDLVEVGVKYRIYITLIKRELTTINIRLSLDQWKNILFKVLREEESTKKINDYDLRDGLIENYIYDFVNVWSWDPIPKIESKGARFLKSMSQQ